MGNQKTWEQYFADMPAALEKIERIKDEDKQTEHLLPKRKPLTPEMTPEEFADAMNRIRK